METRVPFHLAGNFSSPLSPARSNIRLVEKPEVETTRYALIRHAESEWNAADRWQGHGDPPLSDRGRSQADALAHSLEGEPFDLLICSDLQRAVETAQAISRVCGLEPRLDARFRELDVGRWTGLGADEIAAREPEIFARFEALEPDVRPGGGETRREIRERVRAAVEVVAAEHPGRYIALVCHLGVIRALLPGSEPENAASVVTTLGEIRQRVREAGG